MSVYRKELAILVCIVVLAAAGARWARPSMDADLPPSSLRVCVTKDGGHEFTFEARSHPDGRGGTYTATLKPLYGTNKGQVFKEQGSIDADHWSALLRDLAAIPFWDMPTETPPREGRARFVVTLRQAGSTPREHTVRFQGCPEVEYLRLLSCLADGEVGQRERALVKAHALDEDGRPPSDWLF